MLKKPWLSFGKVQVYATIHRLVKTHLHLVGIVLKKHKHASFQANCWPFTPHEKNFLHIDHIKREFFHKTKIKK
jgi:hypothetical protein